jgi:hypothetical protein
MKIRLTITTIVIVFLGTVNYGLGQNSFGRVFNYPSGAIFSPVRYVDAAVTDDNSLSILTRNSNGSFPVRPFAIIQMSASGEFESALGLSSPTYFGAISNGITRHESLVAIGGKGVPDSLSVLMVINLDSGFTWTKIFFPHDSSLHPRNIVQFSDNGEYLLTPYFLESFGIEQPPKLGLASFASNSGLPHFHYYYQNVTPG